MMPILGLAIGALFGLGPELALGLFIIAICPAGTTSNALTFVGRGNVALAVVLTALSSLVTVFTIPVLLSWALPFFLEGGGRAVPDLSVPGTILQRSDERRVGKGGVRKCRSRWSPYNNKKNK